MMFMHMRTNSHVRKNIHSVRQMLCSLPTGAYTHTSNAFSKFRKQNSRSAALASDSWASKSQVILIASPLRCKEKEFEYSYKRLNG